MSVRVLFFRFALSSLAGLLFPAAGVAALRSAMAELWQDKTRCEAMGRAGREKVERICGGHYDALMALYDEARAMTAASVS